MKKYPLTKEKIQKRSQKIIKEPYMKVFKEIWN
jgi:hypothetical protein